MGDIIPPYTYFDADDEPREFGGQNWDARGQVIWQTPNCVPPPPDPPADPKPITPLAGCVELLAGGASAPTSGTRTRTARSGPCHRR